jgi:hypothetical protein
MNIIDVLKELGITDILVLPAKTQRKLKSYNQMVKSPIARDKDGKFKPGAQQKLDDLAEDIVIEAKLFIKMNNQPPVKTEQEIIAEQQAEQKRLDDEAEQKRLDDEAEKKRLNDEAEKKRLDDQKKNKGPLESFLGW